MKLLTTVVVGLLGGLAGLALGRAFVPAEAHDTRAASGEHADLEAELLQRETRLAELAREVRTPLVATPAGGTEPTEAELEAALARWEAAQPRAEAPTPPARAPVLLPNGKELATASLAELVRQLAHGNFGNEERERLFQELRDLGRIDEYVAEIERLAAAAPEDIELQIALGHAYLQKLFGMEGSSEVGAIAWKADQAFDRALVLDEGNWNARFTKAVALSNWPAFLGRGAEAIENFELLIEQQESLPGQPSHFAMPYLFLGNMLQASGQQKEAIATWKDGLARFPDSEQLQAALAAAGAR